MAITRNFRDGTPADNGEITENPNFLERMDLAGSGAACLTDTINDGEDIFIYDIKRTISYASGTWQVILDGSAQAVTGTLKIVVTNAAGAELRDIHDFGTITLPNTTTTFSQAGIAQQDLTSSERLAVLITMAQCTCDQFGFEFDNFDTSCDSRLVTPDEVAAGLSIPIAMHHYKQMRGA